MAPGPGNELHSSEEDRMQQLKDKVAVVTGGLAVWAFSRQEAM